MGEEVVLENWRNTQKLWIFNVSRRNASAMRTNLRNFSGLNTRCWCNSRTTTIGVTFFYLCHIFFLVHVFKIKRHGKQWYTPISGWRSHTSVTKRHSGACAWADIMWTTNVLGEAIYGNRFRFNNNDLLVFFDILLIQLNLITFLERAEKARQLSPRIYRLHMHKIQPTYSNDNQFNGQLFNL